MLHKDWKQESIPFDINECNQSLNIACQCILLFLSETEGGVQKLSCHFFGSSVTNVPPLAVCGGRDGAVRRLPWVHIIRMIARRHLATAGWFVFTVCCARRWSSSPEVHSHTIWHPVCIWTPPPQKNPMTACQPWSNWNLSDSFPVSHPLCVSVKQSSRSVINSGPLLSGPESILSWKTRRKIPSYIYLLYFISSKSRRPQTIFFYQTYRYVRLQLPPTSCPLAQEINKSNYWFRIEHK